MTDCRIEAITQASALDALADEWNALVRVHCGAPPSMDCTATLEWARALIASLPPGDTWFVLVARDHGGIAGILPIRRPAVGRRGISNRDITVLTERFGGRNGFLVRPGAEHALAAMLGHLHTDVDDWDRFQFRVVEGSRSARMIEDLMARNGEESPTIAEEISPYIVMPDDLRQYAGALGSGFMGNLRRREDRLRRAGALRFEVVDDTFPIECFWSAMMEVEARSWKNDAGSAITNDADQTAFYRRLVPMAAGAGQLLGALLWLDERPIAYRLAVALDGVAVGLKTSYASDQRAGAPGNVLHWMYLREIHRRGIRVFDFTGVCEAHKMKWTRETYRITTQLMFRHSVRGRIARLRRDVVAGVRGLKGISAVNP